jgi:type II secretory pathway pseudopilin PulG
MNSQKKYYIVLGVLSVLVVAVATLGFKHTADIKSDAQLESALTAAINTLTSYGSTHINLPTNLKEAGVKGPSKFEYSVKNKTTYELCANFHNSGQQFSSHKIDSGITESTTLPYYGQWPTNHKNGHDCHAFKAALKQVTLNDSNYVLCAEAGYSSFPVSFGLITAVDTFSRSFTVQYSDVKPGTATTPATVQPTPITKTFNLAPNAKIFDYRCHPATYQNLAVNEQVDLYQQSSLTTAVVDGIYIVKQGVAQPSRPL